RRRRSRNGVSALRAKKGKKKMAKLTKAQLKAHREAEAILTKDVLNYDEKLFVLYNWHEGANFTNGAAGAFFTPADLASDFAIEGDVCGKGRKPTLSCVSTNE
ncbi:TPA: hypothetical protein ACGE77_005400, partial [Klebsiella pneumoniae]